MDFPIPDDALWILEQLEKSGYEGYLVGGCVRDSLLGLTPKDYDLCSSAPPDRLLAIFSDCRTVENGIKHGTVGVCLSQSVYEITTYRSDDGYTDHRHPDSVTFVSDISADLARRDFTVNAMAYHPTRGLIDPYGGLDDLKCRLIRAVGEPCQRFREDGLRILRGLRFASVYGFSIEPTTADAIHSSAPLLSSIAAERVRTEFFKLLCGATVAEILRDYRDVVAVFLPEIENLSGDDYRVLLRRIAALPADPICRLAILLHTLESTGQRAAVAPICERLRLDRASQTRLLRLTKCLSHPLPSGKPELRQLIGFLGKTDGKLYLTLTQAEADSPDALSKIDGLITLYDRILQTERCFRVEDLPISGRDLIGLGLSPGPEIGLLLERLLDGVLTEEVPPERDQLMLYAKKMIEFMQNC